MSGGKTWSRGTWSGTWEEQRKEPGAKDGDRGGGDRLGRPSAAGQTAPRPLRAPVSAALHGSHSFPEATSHLSHRLLTCCLKSALFLTQTHAFGKKQHQTRNRCVWDYEALCHAAEAGTAAGPGASWGDEAAALSHPSLPSTGPDLCPPACPPAACR